MSSRNKYSSQSEKMISKSEADNATRTLKKYYSQQAKTKGKLAYKKGAAAAKKGTQSFGKFIKKLLTTK